MEISASISGVGLPLSRRLKRALLIALLFGLWAPCKIVWEQRIASEQDFLRYRGFTMTRHLRDELGQGLTIGVLSGMRSVVADLIWLNVTLAWMNEEWFRMGGYTNLCIALQPRAPVFADMGGWHLAWNASIATANDRKQPNELRRIKGARFWVDRGLEIYLRGIENNPEYWRLWADTGMLYDQRLKNYPKAADYYQRASELPNAPIYLERFSAIMYDDKHGRDNIAAYERWVALYKKLTPSERAMKFHEGDRLEAEIRKLEQKLSIPNEKRVFPN